MDLPKALRGATALVTGGAGFIGGHLSAALARGCKVRVLDNLSTGRPENVPDGVEFIRADVRSRDAVRAGLRGVDYVFHEAALPSVARSVEDPLSTHDVNVNGTLEVLEACRVHDVPNLVFAASSSAYGDSPVLPKREDMPIRPLSPYAASKVSAEAYVAAYARVYGLRSVSLRYFNVYGPRQDPNSPYAAVVPRFIRAAIRGEPLPINGDGRQTRDFTYVDDAVQANLLAAASSLKGEAINIAGGKQVTILALARTLGRVLGRRLPLAHAPARPGDIRHSRANLRLARDLLGYSPKMGLLAGLRETVAATTRVEVSPGLPRWKPRGRAKVR